MRTRTFSNVPESEFYEVNNLSINYVYAEDSAETAMGVEDISEDLQWPKESYFNW